jgi:hypothetical protein
MKKSHKTVNQMEIYKRIIPHNSEEFIPEMKVGITFENQLI